MRDAVKGATVDVAQVLQKTPIRGRQDVRRYFTGTNRFSSSNQSSTRVMCAALIG